MPDTPMILMPPSMPSRGLKVRRAISAPLGTEMVILRDLPNCSKLCFIISRGALLMAGEPGG